MIPEVHFLSAMSGELGVNMTPGLSPVLIGSLIVFVLLALVAINVLVRSRCQQKNECHLNKMFPKSVSEQCQTNIGGYCGEQVERGTSSKKALGFPRAFYKVLPVGFT